MTYEQQLVEAAKEWVRQYRDACGSGEMDAHAEVWRLAEKILDLDEADTLRQVGP